MISFKFKIKKYGAWFFVVFLFSLSNICAQSISLERFWGAVLSENTDELGVFFDELENFSPSKSEITDFLREFLSSKYADYSLSTVFQRKYIKPSIYNFVGLQCPSVIPNFLVDPIKYIFSVSDIRNHPLLSSYLLQMEIDFFDIEELPGNMVIGAVEMFCGVLLVIIPNPLTRAAGAYLISNGATRMFDGLEILDEKNKELQKESCAYTQNH